MIGLFVRFDVRDESSARLFDDLTEAVVERIRTEEPGTLVYATHRVDGEPLARIFYEVYADGAAFQAHEGALTSSSFTSARTRSLLGDPELSSSGQDPPRAA